MCDLRHRSELPKCFAAIVLEQTSYVPSDTMHKLMLASFELGFQSSRVVSKSSANLRQSPKNFPVETSEPELHAKNIEKIGETALADDFSHSPEIIVFSKVMTTAPLDSNS